MEFLPPTSPNPHQIKQMHQQKMQLHNNALFTLAEMDQIHNYILEMIDSICFIQLKKITMDKRRFCDRLLKFWFNINDNFTRYLEENYEFSFSEKAGLIIHQIKDPESKATEERSQAFHELNFLVFNDKLYKK